MLPRCLLVVVLRIHIRTQIRCHTHTHHLHRATAIYMECVCASYMCVVYETF
jgi:hypothetical protein